MCDVLVALGVATATGRTLFAKNSDRPPTERQVVEYQGPRLDDVSTRLTHVSIPAATVPTHPCVLSRPAWGWGAEHGVNVHGLAVGNTTVYTTLDPRGSGPGPTGMDLVRLALERAATVDDAVEVITSLLRRHGQGGSGHDPAAGRERPYWNAFLLADPWSAAVIDTSGTEFAVERVADVRAISNRTTIREFDAVHRHPRQPVDRLVDPRWRASRTVLADRPVSTDTLAAHLRSHDSCGDEGWSVCMHVEGVEETTASMVASLAPAGASELWVMTGHPCRGEYRHLTFVEAATTDLSGV